MEHGAFLVARDSEFALSKPVLEDLAWWCSGFDKQQSENEFWNTRKEEDDTEDYQRYSFNARRNKFEKAWQGVFEDGAFGRLLNVIEKLMDGSAQLSTVGGDCARGNATKMQSIHSDGAPSARADEATLDIVEWLVVSIAVRDVSADSGPLYFVGRQAMYAHDGEEPNASGTCVADYDKYFFGDTDQTGAVTLQQGDCLVRHPLVWHSGTTNKTGEPRYLPGLVFKAAFAAL